MRKKSNFVKQILLIEDDPFLIDIYSQKLTKAGFKVEVAKNGKSALQSLRERKPQLVILDIVLPGIEGWEILRKIKKDRSLTGLKVVVLSNLGQKEEVEKGLKLGAVKYLIKAHYTPGEVVREIEKVITNS